MANVDDDYTDCGYFIDAVRLECGDSGVNKVLDARGGVTIRIPACPKPGFWLSRVIGHEKAIKVCARITVRDADNKIIRYPRITLPLGFRSSVKKLVSRVDRGLLEGLSASKVALLAGVNERTVWRRRAVLVEQGLLTSNKPRKTAERAS